MQKNFSLELAWINLSVLQVYLCLFKDSSYFIYLNDLSNLSFRPDFYLKAFQCTKLWYAQVVVQFFSKKC